MADANAYLVLHRGSRWTDVYRLKPAEAAILGRSSTNQIVLRSSRASRQHAKIAWGGDSRPGWWVEDLASRNGVIVNGKRIECPERLSQGDRLDIAGFELRFTQDLADSEFSSPGDSHVHSQDDLTQDALSIEMDASECLDIVSTASGDLVRSASNRARPTSQRLTADQSTKGSIDRALLQMAFAMGRAKDCDEATDLLLETLNVAIPDAEIGIYHDVNHPSLPPPRRMHQRPGRRYRRPPESLVQQLYRPNATSVLARNVLGDATLATENTEGVIDVESIILVPLFDTLSSEAVTNGLVHITTAAKDASLTDQDLALVVTASEIFTESLRLLSTQASLQNDLHQTRQTVKRLQNQLAGRIQILGRSEPIREVQRQISQVAVSGAAVLLRGESGVGKELVASAIHHASSRADQPMVCLNCAALSKDLLESELFGHEEGAFTGATQQKRGKFESASGGTLMLDEIGEMNLDLQAKLLRVLEGHPFERVGGHESVKVDVRVIAATHRDLQSMVQSGTFRQDLFYRLHVIEIVVPPLRQRDRDILLLADHFITMLTQSMGRRKTQLTPDAAKKLQSYSWPGNVRELRNVIERAVVMQPQDQGEVDIDAKDLLLAPTQTEGSPIAMSEVFGRSDGPSLSLAKLEQQHIEQVLQQTGGNKSQASMILGIERSTLDRKLKRYAQES